MIHTEGYLLRTMYNSTELRLAFLRIDKDYIYTRGRSLGCGTVYELTFNSSAIIVVIENTKFGVRAYLVVELRTTSGNALHLRYDLDLVQHSWYWDKWRYNPGKNFNNQSASDLSIDPAKEPVLHSTHTLSGFSWGQQFIWLVIYRLCNPPFHPFITCQEWKIMNGSKVTIDSAEARNEYLNRLKDLFSNSSRPYTYQHDSEFFSSPKN